MFLVEDLRLACALHFLLVMRIKSVLLSLGLLSSTVAFADRPYRSTTWQPLTSVERLERGGDVFDLRQRARFDQLRLQNQAGRMFVRQIDVVFADGSRQCVQVNRQLVGNHDMIEIDLDGNGRRIARVLVDGRSARDGSYQLYAM